MREEPATHIHSEPLPKPVCSRSTGEVWILITRTVKWLAADAMATTTSRTQINCCRWRINRRDNRRDGTRWQLKSHLERAGRVCKHSPGSNAVRLGRIP